MAEPDPITVERLAEQLNAEVIRRAADLDLEQPDPAVMRSAAEQIAAVFAPYFPADLARPEVVITGPDGPTVVHLGRLGREVLFCGAATLLFGLIFHPAAVLAGPLLYATARSSHKFADYLGKVAAKLLPQDSALITALITLQYDPKLTQKYSFFPNAGRLREEANRRLDPERRFRDDTDVVSRLDVLKAEGIVRQREGGWDLTHTVIPIA